MLTIRPHVLAAMLAATLTVTAVSLGAPALALAGGAETRPVPPTTTDPVVRDQPPTTTPARQQSSQAHTPDSAIHRSPSAVSTSGSVV